MAVFVKEVVNNPATFLPVGANEFFQIGIIKIVIILHKLLPSFQDTYALFFVAKAAPFIRVNFKFTECDRSRQFFCFQEFSWWDGTQPGRIKYLPFIINEGK